MAFGPVVKLLVENEDGVLVAAGYDALVLLAIGNVVLSFDYMHFSIYSDSMVVLEAKYLVWR